LTIPHQVIYVAASRGQAYTLKNLLVEHGIAAHVSNDFAGDVYAGDPTSHRDAPCVVVPEQDAEQARQILEDAASAIERGLPSPELAQLEAEAGDDDQWPACPHCGRGRLTSCPVCETAGTHFAKAFMPDFGPDDEQSAADREDALMVLCPTCDEPFAAQFPSRCEWCGHRFSDGYEPPPVALQAVGRFSASDVGSRVVIVALGLVAFVAALFGWFYYILY
jgi:Putative prokaryotic signal transducing protein